MKKYAGSKIPVQRSSGGKNSGLKKLYRYLDSLTDEDRIQMMRDYLSNDPYASIRREREIQAKLEIDSPDSIHEQQADEIGKKVSNNENAADLVKNHPEAEVSRQTSLQDDKKAVPEVTTDFQNRLQSTKGGGQHLDDTTKSTLENNMGTDLSGVKIHTDAKANELSENINAKAFTHGQDIYFKQGNYNPESKEGKELLGHELAHTVQQGGRISGKLQKMDDPKVIEERSKLKKMTPWQITKELGAGYELKRLQQLFFGSLEGTIPAWRNQLISYYLIERGWEADKDSPPQWVEHKYIADEEGKDVLVVFTPIPGLLGREAAFGFVRWDLGIEPGKKFYRYQEKKEDFDAANSIALVKQHEQEGKNEQMGTITKVEKLFSDADYVPAQPKVAIQLAIALVTDYVTKDYILNPGISGQGPYLSHRNFNEAKIGELLSTEKSRGEMGVGIKKKKASRRGDFYTAQEGAKTSVLETREGFRKATRKEVENYSGGIDVMFNDRTTLGIAKEIFIDGKEYSPEQLVEEGIGANMLIRYFGEYKERIGKAVFFAHAYGTMSYEALKKAEDAMQDFTETILSAYKNPENPVSFSKGDALLSEAYSALYKSVYGEGGIFDKRVDFAKNAFKELKTNNKVNHNAALIKYIEDAMAGKKPAQLTTDSKETKPLTPVDLQPLGKIETAIGIIDVMSQVAMLAAFRDARIQLMNSGKYYDQFDNIFQQINNLFYVKKDGNELQVNKLVEKARVLMLEPKYEEGVKIDVGFHKLQTELKQNELKFVIIGATVVAAIGSAGLGAFVAGFVEGALGSTVLWASAQALIVTTTEIAVGALTMTLLQETIAAALEGKKWGEHFGRNLVVNLFLFGAFKVVEIAVVGRGAVPTGARKLGNGLWESISAKATRPVYYLEEGIATATEATNAIVYSNVGELSSYQNIVAELPQVRATLQSAQIDANLIENALRKVDKKTLDFFESNPGKLEEAAKGIAVDADIAFANPVFKLTQATKYLDGFAKTITEAGKGIEIVPQLTDAAKNHIKNGEVKIIIKDSNTGAELSVLNRLPSDPPFAVPAKGVNIKVEAKGIHFESTMKPGLVEEVPNTRELVTTLSTGEKVYKVQLKVFVKEGNNGTGIWKTIADKKTLWPATWSEEKIWEEISEAFKNKTIFRGNRYHGLTKDGVKIEMYISEDGNIDTAYIIPKEHYE